MGNGLEEKNTCLITVYFWKQPCTAGAGKKGKNNRRWGVAVSPAKGNEGRRRGACVWKKGEGEGRDLLHLPAACTNTD